MKLNLLKTFLLINDSELYDILSFFAHLSLGSSIFVSTLLFIAKQQGIAIFFLLLGVLLFTSWYMSRYIPTYLVLGEFRSDILIFADKGIKVFFKDTNMIENAIQAVDTTEKAWSHLYPIDKECITYVKGVTMFKTDFNILMQDIHTIELLRAEKKVFELEENNFMKRLSHVE